MDMGGLLGMIADRFRAAGVRYALIGGFAMHAAGYERATGDIDALVHGDDAEKVRATLLSLGYKIIHDDFNVMNSVSPWVLTGGVDVLWARRKYALDMLASARPAVVAGGIAVPAVRPEGVIGLKVQAIANDPDRRSRDLADIEWLLKECRDLNMALVREYFGLFNMTLDLDRILERNNAVEP